MKSFKVTYNKNKPVIVCPEEVSHAQVSITDTHQDGEPFEVKIWGYFSDEEKYDQYIWLNEKLDVNDHVTIECVDSESSDKPLVVEELGPLVPTCSFCHKTKDEVTCLIEAEHKVAHICDECVDVCLGVIKEHQGKKNDA